MAILTHRNHFLYFERSTLLKYIWKWPTWLDAHNLPVKRNNNAGKFYCNTWWATNPYCVCIGECVNFIGVSAKYIWFNSISREVFLCAVCIVWATDKSAYFVCLALRRAVGSNNIILLRTCAMHVSLAISRIASLRIFIFICHIFTFNICHRNFCSNKWWHL